VVGSEESNSTRLDKGNVVVMTVFSDVSLACPSHFISVVLLEHSMARALSTSVFLRHLEDIKYLLLVTST
jgi:hypothetical protein